LIGRYNVLNKETDNHPKHGTEEGPNHPSDKVAHNYYCNNFQHISNRDHFVLMSVLPYWLRLLAGVDSAWEQKKLEARKMLENAAESPASSARFVGRSSASTHARYQITS
jgi:hypothetical protein